MTTSLNPAQLEAVRTLEGPLLVLAGAGTGKTRVVTYRIANLIRSGIRPERILAVTFTKKAATEMQQRAGALLSRNGRPAARARGKKADAGVRPEISTFHSLCVRILRRHIRQLGYPEKFVICDRGEQETHARAALRELRAPSTALAPGDLLGFIGRWKTVGARPEKAAAGADGEREILAAAGYRRYQDNLKKLGAVDFDDLLLLTEELFETFPAARKTEAARFDHVLIDEYQDTNHSQYQIVRGLAKDHRNLCVVGDDDQSIYAWRGAEVAHILRFQKDWAKTKVVRLEDNYRSTAEILHYANTLIAFNRQRHEKTLRPAKAGGTRPVIMQCKDETDEAIRVVGSIRRQLDGAADRGERVEPRDIAILCRTNEQPRSFETELRRANVPYVLVGGMSFFDRKEVRDILAYLKVIDNPHDELALRRIINQPPRGIGDAAQKRLLDEATARGTMLWNVLAEAIVVDGVDAKTADSVRRFVRLVEQFRARQAKIGIAELVSQVIVEISYRDSLARLYPDPMERESRLSALEEIVNAAGSYEAGRRGATGASLGAFLDDILLGERDESDEKESQLARNAVALMTLHSAKGLEFPHVYLVGMEEGILPHKRSVEADGAAIDEERRLCYVGVTRAREQLTLSFALTRRKWGKARKTVPSRFLYEMTGQAEKAGAGTGKEAQTAARKARKPMRGALKATQEQIGAKHACEAHTCATPTGESGRKRAAAGNKRR
jgi:DNA helicase-2/ATP-dependent DNA helicase PcrA